MQILKQLMQCYLKSKNNFLSKDKNAAVAFSICIEHHNKASYRDLISTSAK